MPSARILTRAVEEAGFLAEDLRRRGFQVQVVSPDNIPNEPVDLEVTLEECETEAALRRVDAHPEAEDLCVFVAPGALIESYRPMRVVPIFPEVPEVKDTIAPASEPAIEIPVTPIGQEDVISTAAPAAATVEAWPVEPVASEISEPPPSKVAVLWEAKKAAASEAGESIAAACAEAGGKFAAWGRQIGSSKRALRRTAILAAAGAAVAVWILMLGATARHVSPIPVSVAETTVAPAAKPVAKPPVVADAATAKPAAEPAPAKPRAHRVVSRPAPARNPEEDVVAKDFVIRYNRRSPQTRTQAKKISPGVKYYSDLH